MNLILWSVTQGETNPCGQLNSINIRKEMKLCHKIVFEIARFYRVMAASENVTVACETGNYYKCTISMLSVVNSTGFRDAVGPARRHAR